MYSNTNSSRTLLLTWIFLLIGLFFGSCKKEFSADLKTESALKYFNAGLHDQVNSVQRTADGGFIYCGSTIIGKGNKQGFLLKTDAQGNKLWYKNIGGPLEEIFNDAIQCSDGGVIAVGTTTMLYAGQYSQMDYVVKTNKDGDVLWSKSFTDGTFALNVLTAVTETDDHLIHATGFYPSDFVWMDPFYLKFDLDGNLKLLTHEPPKDQRTQWAGGWDIIKTMDGGTLIATSTTDYATGISSPGLLAINPNGSTRFYEGLFQKSKISVMDNIRHINKFELAETEDAYYLAYDMDLYIGGQVQSSIELLKLNKNGGIIWTRNFFGQKNAIIGSLLIDHDGKLLVCGSTTETSFSSGASEGFPNLKPMIIKINENGDIISTDFIPSDKQAHIGRNLQSHAGGGYSLAGSSTLDYYGYDKMFVMHTDRDLKFVK